MQKPKYEYWARNTLGVPEGATQEEIKAAYEEKLKDFPVFQAYQVLKIDEEKESLIQSSWKRAVKQFCEIFGINDTDNGNSILFSGLIVLVPVVLVGIGYFLWYVRYGVNYRIPLEYCSVDTLIINFCFGVLAMVAGFLCSFFNAKWLIPKIEKAVEKAFRRKNKKEKQRTVKKELITVFGCLFVMGAFGGLLALFHSQGSIYYEYEMVLGIMYCTVAVYVLYTIIEIVMQSDANRKKRKRMFMRKVITGFVFFVIALSGIVVASSFSTVECVDYRGEEYIAVYLTKNYSILEKATIVDENKEIIIDTSSFVFLPNDSDINLCYTQRTFEKKILKRPETKATHFVDSRKRETKEIIKDICLFFLRAVKSLNRS